MIIFAAGNKYKVINKYLIKGNWYIFGYKWIKSRNTFRTTVGTYNVGPHYEEIGE